MYPGSSLTVDKPGEFTDGTRFIVMVDKHRRSPENCACNYKHNQYDHSFRCSLLTVRGVRMSLSSPQLMFGCKECEDDPANYFQSIHNKIKNMLAVLYNNVSVSRIRDVASFAVDLAVCPTQEEMTTYAFQQIQIQIYPKPPEESVGSCSVGYTSPY